MRTRLERRRKRLARFHRERQGIKIRRHDRRGRGNNRLFGGGGTNTVSYAGASAGVIVGLGADTATGDGTDTVTGFTNVIGSALDDTVAPFPFGSFALTGGGGVDTVDFSHFPAKVTVDFGTGSVTSGGTSATVSGFEDVRDTPFADALTGDASGNRLAGLGGNDNINAVDGIPATTRSTGGRHLGHL